jgi:protease I
MVNTTNGTQQIRVAILIENQFEDSEFQIPYTALKQANAKTVVVGTRMNDEYHGKHGKVSIKPQATATEVRAEDFEAIVIPGGGAPDLMRTNPNVIRLVHEAVAQNKLIAAVCHGPQVLIEADQLHDKRVTGYRAIRKDIENAGATYIDEPVVSDGNLITARQPSDLPMFTTAILGRLGLAIEGMLLPDPTDRNVEWWHYAERWGGSSRQDIVNALNTAIVGERYTLSSFKHYRDRVSDPELRLVLEEIIATKERHTVLLEERLNLFSERITWQTASSEAYATLQGWLLQANDDLAILRRALGDIQTGLVDANHLSSQITDPITTELFMQIAENLLRAEERLATLYRARKGESVEPPLPTTIAAS